MALHQKFFFIQSLHKLDDIFFILLLLLYIFIISHLITSTEPYVAHLLICFVCSGAPSLKTKSVRWAKISPRSEAVHHKPPVSVFGKHQRFCLFQSDGHQKPQRLTRGLISLMRLISSRAGPEEEGDGCHCPGMWTRDLFNFVPSFQSPDRPHSRTSRHKGAVCFSFPVR